MRLKDRSIAQVKRDNKKAIADANNANLNLKKLDVKKDKTSGRPPIYVKLAIQILLCIILILLSIFVFSLCYVIIRYIIKIVFYIIMIYKIIKAYYDGGLYPDEEKKLKDCAKIKEELEQKLKDKEEKDKEEKENK